jgi:hypothetical protein
MGYIGGTTRAIVRARSGGWCEIRWDAGCTQIGESIHHLLGRADGGRNTAYNLVDSCDACHVEVHRPTNRDEAIGRGLIRTSKSRAAAALQAIVGEHAAAWMALPGGKSRPRRVTPPVKVGDRVVNVDAADWSDERADELLAALGLRTLVGVR